MPTKARPLALGFFLSTLLSPIPGSALGLLLQGQYHDLVFCSFIILLSKEKKDLKILSSQKRGGMRGIPFEPF